MEQKNWAIVRIVVGYHSYDTEAELLLLNKIWALQSKLTNYFYPHHRRGNGLSAELEALPRPIR